MSKIVLGSKRGSRPNKIHIINKIRCKTMDSRNRNNNNNKKKKAAKPSNGIFSYLKSVFVPCSKSKRDTNDKDTPDKPEKPKKHNRKSKIPLAMKQTVWVNQFGEIYKHKCVTKWCHRIITVFDFEVGHNIPESKGGITSPENLKPICRQCNIGMGNRYTIDEWSKKKFLDKK